MVIVVGFVMVWILMWIEVVNFDFCFVFDVVYNELLMWVFVEIIVFDFLIGERILVFVISCDKDFDVILVYFFICFDVVVLMCFIGNLCLVIFEKFCELFVSCFNKMDNVRFLFDYIFIVVDLIVVY